MRRTPLFSVIFGTLACLASGAGVAQESPQGKESAPAKADPAQLDTVVVTANKRVENIRKVGSSISVIGEEQLESIHATQLTDYAGYVPGLQVNSNGTPGQTSVTMRGIATLSSGSTVGYYMDEMPLGSSGIYQNATLYALDLLPYDIQRVEVLRGPQGTLYGAGSMGGLLKYVSREPDLSTAEYRIGGGLSNVKGADGFGNNIRFGANIPLSEDRLGLRLSYTRNDIPGYIDNAVDGEEDINDGSQTSARVAMLWRGDGFDLTLTAMQQGIDSDNNAIVALDPATQKPLYGDLSNEIYFDEPFSKDIDMFSATIDWDLGWANLMSATGYSDTLTKQRTDATLLYGEFTNLGLGLPDPGSSYLDYRLALEKFTQEFRLTSKSGGPFEWMLGAFYTKEDAENSQILGLRSLDGSPLPPPYDSMFGILANVSIPSDYEEIAVFANGSYRFNEWFKLDAGMRYASNDQSFTQSVTEGILLPLGDSSNTSSEDVFTWSLSPQFQLSEDVMLYAKAATGYQPGGPNVLVPGLPPAVESSTLTSYEIGLKSQFADDRVTFDIVAFRIDWEDIQVVSQVNGIGGIVNGGKAVSQGLELSTVFQATERLRLGFNGAYTDAELSDDFPTIYIPSPPYMVELNTGLAGDLMPYVPELSWAATADYSFPIGTDWNGHVGGGIRWIDDRVSGTTNRQVITLPTDPPTVLATTITPPIDLDSYYSFDVYADASNENWTIRAYVKNLTDERAYTSMTDITNALTGVTSVVKAAPIQPRTLGIEVDYRF
ncbi:MAG TPA: TonB-dependent receptor [Arenimonas sp.]|nr:TonB-dependent receptor [Arenimonas sp.]